MKKWWNCIGFNLDIGGLVIYLSCPVFLIFVPPNLMLKKCIFVVVSQSRLVLALVVHLCQTWHQFVLSCSALRTKCVIGDLALVGTGTSLSLAMYLICQTYMLCQGNTCLSNFFLFALQTYSCIWETQFLQNR